MEFSTLTPLPSLATSATAELVLATAGGGLLTSDDLPAGLPQASRWTLPAVTITFRGATEAPAVLFGDLATICPGD